MLKWLSKDRNISRIIRIWGAGACCLFIIWGSPIGQETVVDMISVMGIVLGIVEMFVLTPLANHLIGLKPKHSQSIYRRVVTRLAVFAKVLITLVFVFGSYYYFTELLIGHGMITSTALIEPIGFGLLYMFYFEILHWISNSIRKIWEVRLNVEK
ncbi:hypothetical protein [Lapidilactobacillus bayanensis]|uniref:hypothetical protein n=1 Tax=Lapidilactobacillus bayanensis TaxID=2485998 RepID=UPI000F7BA15B|nr:hypothetical protein [Lapidilactobacillus bayanensis]